MDFLYLVTKLIFALIIVFGLMFVALKCSNKGMSKFTDKKYVKVIDKVQISKDNYILILKIGEKGMIVMTSNNHTEKLQELSKEEVLKIEEDKKENYQEMSKVFNKLIKKIKSKEDKNEDKEKV